MTAAAAVRPEGPAGPDAAMRGATIDRGGPLPRAKAMQLAKATRRAVPTRRGATIDRATVTAIVTSSRVHARSRS